MRNRIDVCMPDNEENKDAKDKTRKGNKPINRIRSQITEKVVRVSKCSWAKRPCSRCSYQIGRCYYSISKRVLNSKYKII